MSCQTTQKTASFSPPSSSCSKKSLHGFAQRLNNSAASCIEIGLYDRAIGSLQRALRLSEMHMNNGRNIQAKTEGSSVRHCRECTLDDCISFSEANALHLGDNGSSRLTGTAGSVERGHALAFNSSDSAISTGDHSTNIRHSSKRRRVEVPAAVEPNTTTTEDLATFVTDSRAKKKKNDDAHKTCRDKASTRRTNKDMEHSISVEARTTTNDRNKNYVYNRPIRIPKHNHEIGSILYVVVLFNLALAHHLKAITTSTMTANPNNPFDAEDRAKVVNRALLLYQLVLEYWSKLQHPPQQDNAHRNNIYGSIRFRMILFNNLSQMYRLTKNHAREKECLAHLLSTVLVITDRTSQNNTRWSGSSPTTVTTPSEHGTRSRSHDTADRRSPMRRDLEGFLTNASALMLENLCAEAA